jgi:lathosterol oxidase
MNISNFLGPEVFEQSIFTSTLSYFFQNTLATISILLLFGLVILHEPISHLFIKEDKTDQQKFETKYFWQTMVLIPLVSVPFLWVMYRFGIFEIHATAKTLWLMVLQLVVMMILHDTYFYWCHRLLHTKRFWDIHGIHHRDTDPTIVTSHIFHYIETIINYTFLVWFTLLAGLLVGGLFFIPALIFVVFTITWNIYGHGTKNLLPDRITKSWLGQWIVWPSYHLEHHRQGTGNYEFFFTWWDRLMKTQVK